MNIVSLGTKKINLAGELPVVGTTAPDFSLLDNQLKSYTLADLGTGRKILYIVPSLDTPLCAKTTKSLDAMITTDARCVVISADLPLAQQRFCKSESLEHITSLSTLNDPGFGKRYGVLMTDGPLKDLLARILLVLDENNQLVYVELVRDIAKAPDFNSAMKILLETP